MKFFLNDKNYKKIAEALSKTSMPFLANPPMSQAETYQGILEYPGFHTASTFEVAAAYAVGRVLNWSTEEDDSGNHYVTDYPVVVKLDMSEFSPKTDYDAEELVKVTLKSQLDQFIDLYDVTSMSDGEIEEAGQEFIEDSYLDSGDFVDWSDSGASISEVTFSFFENPFPVFLNLTDFSNLVRNYLVTKEIPDNVLMEVTQQFRYTEDVPENNLKAVYYLTPISKVVDSDYGWDGFLVPSMEDFSYGSFDYEYELVYGDDSSEGQYHGTTYNNLLNAAPELGKGLPEPPKPYIG